MVFPERFSNLTEHVWPRLRGLLDVHEGGGDVLNLTIGEPRHAWPPFVTNLIAANDEGFGKYPPNDGTPELLQANADWVARRYGVTLDSEKNFLSLNGTREGLYNAMMALCPETKNGRKPAVLVPNPFYQVYAVSALSVGADTVFLPSSKETGFLPDYSSVDAETLERTAIVYICSPSNPEGAVASRDYWRDLFDLAEKHDFKIFADECYSEVYRDEKPMGAIQAAAEFGADPERLMIFHSLSKRSNLPGLRSGFAAGGPESIARMKQLRAYAGSPLPLPLMRAAEAVWADEDHVEASRLRYVAKYDIADEAFSGIDGWGAPEAGFFLWLPVEDGEAAAVKLWKETGIRILPGAYLSVEANGENPGKGYIRVAMVAEEEELRRGLAQIRDCLVK